MALFVVDVTILADPSSAPVHRPIEQHPTAKEDTTEISAQPRSVPVSCPVGVATLSGADNIEQDAAQNNDRYQSNWKHVKIENLKFLRRFCLWSCIDITKSTCLG